MMGSISFTLPVVALRYIVASLKKNKTKKKSPITTQCYCVTSPLWFLMIRLLFKYSLYGENVYIIYTDV